jgi:hypothetical protein
VHGDTNKFYPVIIKAGNQDVKRIIMVKRWYAEAAPSDWNTATHKGALTLKILCNFGGWGGTTYSWEISEFQEQYSDVFGGASTCGNSCMFAIFLRGGGEDGAIYHLYSDQSLTANLYNYGWDEKLQNIELMFYQHLKYLIEQIMYNISLICVSVRPETKLKTPLVQGIMTIYSIRKTHRHRETWCRMAL